MERWTSEDSEMTLDSKDRASLRDVTLPARYTITSDLNLRLFRSRSDAGTNRV